MQKRIFIALNVPAEGVRLIASRVRSIRKELPGIIWEKPEKWHITVHFLGAIPASKIRQVGEILIKLTIGLHPFSVSLSGLTFLPNHTAPKILILPLEPCQALSSFQAGLSSALSVCGIGVRENRTFTPHLTIGRIRNTKETGGFEKMHHFHVKMWISTVSLIESTLEPDGSSYARISTIHLK